MRQEATGQWERAAAAANAVMLDPTFLRLVRATQWMGRYASSANDVVMVPTSVVDGVGFDTEEASRWAGSATFRRFGVPAGPLPAWGCRPHPAADGCWDRTSRVLQESGWGAAAAMWDATAHHRAVLVVRRPLVFDSLVAAGVTCVVSPPEPLAEDVVLGVLGRDAGGALLRRTRFIAVAGDGPEPSLFVVDRGSRSYR